MLNALGYQNLDSYVDKHTSAMINDPDYETKKKLTTTYICMHLNEENVSRFVGADFTVYEPKELWDAIVSHYAIKSLENAATVWDKLFEIQFSDRNMKEAINAFRNTFRLLIEVTADKLDKKTLEACCVFLILKRLPPSFSVFRTIQFASLKQTKAKLELTSFLKDLESELRRQNEVSGLAQSTLSATALAVSSSGGNNSGNYNKSNP
jgi:hypothetical protein